VKVFVLEVSVVVRNPIVEILLLFGILLSRSTVCYRAVCIL
jgi:hypothetical protein